MSVTSANRLELLQIADAVAREKMIDPSLVIEAMEDSLGKAARSRYGAEYDIRARLDAKTGDLRKSRTSSPRSRWRTPRRSSRTRSSATT
jgi:N utilization substance protein A